jgi:GT2 family glycosyltransferase
MKVLALIVSYNFEPWLDKCLSSLRASTYPCDVLVVDNASTDQTVRRIREAYPEVIVHENKDNAGFGAANNWGLRYALKQQYNAVFLVNQDTYISEECIEVLNQTSKNHPDYGIISPVHFNGQGDDLDFGFKAYTRLKTVYELPGDEIVPSGFINAAFWWLPIRTVKKVGGFSPLFSHYGEDVDYANRTLHHGLKMGYVPRALAYHCRENRKNSEEKLLHAEYLYFLTEAVNLTKSSGAAFAYSVLAAVKKGVLAPFKQKKGLPYWKMAFKILATKTGYYRKKSALPRAYL